MVAAVVGTRYAAFSRVRRVVPHVVRKERGVVGSGGGSGSGQFSGSVHGSAVQFTVGQRKQH